MSTMKTTTPLIMVAVTITVIYCPMPGPWKLVAGACLLLAGLTSLVEAVKDRKNR